MRTRSWSDLPVGQITPGDGSLQIPDIRQDIDAACTAFRAFGSYISNSRCQNPIARKSALHGAAVRAPQLDSRSTYDSVRFQSHRAHIFGQHSLTGLLASAGEAQPILLSLQYKRPHAESARGKHFEYHLFKSVSDGQT